MADPRTTVKGMVTRIEEVDLGKSKHMETLISNEGLMGSSYGVQFEVNSWGETKLLIANRISL